MLRPCTNKRALSVIIAAAAVYLHLGAKSRPPTDDMRHFDECALRFTLDTTNLIIQVDKIKTKSLLLQIIQSCLFYVETSAITEWKDILVMLYGVSFNN